jgi:hypothetical protein
MATQPKQLRHEDAAHLTDGVHIFQVPKKHAEAILNAIEGLRHSFEDVGGRFISHPKQKD